VIGGQRVADPHAGVVAGHREPPVPQRVHQRDQVAGQGAGVVAVLGLAGQPGAALVGRDHEEVPGQGGHHQPPGVPGLRPAVHQQQRRAVAPGDHVLAQIARVDVPAGERAGEPGREVRRTRHRARAFRDGRVAGR
jgi:hypothetical protein